VPLSVSRPTRRGAPRCWLGHAPARLVGVGLTGVFLAVAVLADWLAPTDPFAAVGPPLQPPSAAYPLGTDDLGRDLLAGIIHGARTSALVVLTVTCVATLVGVPIGALAGYWGGRLDAACLRLTECVQVVPRLFLAVLVVALLGPGLDRLVLVLGLTTWPGLARVVRAETMALTRRAFVEAARALGASPTRLLLRHILPQALPATMVVISSTAASVLLLEAGLAFLGLGDPERMSWGYLAYNAQRFLRVAWWMVAFPGTAMMLAIMGLHLLGDTVNELLAPRGSA
jgi:peptide/nickel transport system permease protein